MAERPVLFNGEMVRAILAGRKTQTRRPVVPTSRDGRLSMIGDEWRFVSSRDTFTGAIDYERGEWCWQNRDDIKRVLVERCPLGQPGDRLWVRETWDADYPTVRYGADNMFRIIELEEHRQQLIKLFDTQRGEWRPSIHMPRWASRITLEITDVRVQRVQEISEEDARSEGLDSVPEQWRGGFAESYREQFGRLWSSIYGAESWDQNAWVWAVTFRRVEPAP